MTTMQKETKAKIILAEAGLEAAWAVYEAGNDEKYEERVICDIVGRLARFGYVSDKQLAYVRTLIGKIAERPAIEAARAAERDMAEPLPVGDGRVMIEGEVLSVKTYDTNFGPSTKMLVRSDAGWKVFGKRPISIADVNRGDRVRFEARIEPSKDDAKFGFLSRPTKAEIVSRAAVAA